MGAFSSNNRVFDVKCLLIFVLIGLFFKAFKLPGTPLIIGFILGPMFEESLRRALQASHGNWSIFLTRPISYVFLIIFMGFCAITIRKNLEEQKKRKPEEIYLTLRGKTDEAKSGRCAMYQLILKNGEIVYRDISF